MSSVHDTLQSVHDSAQAPLSSAAPYPYPFRVLHLLLLVLSVVMFCLGILIHAGSPPHWSFLGDQYPAWLPTGRWGMWHVLGGAVLLGTFLPALVYYLVRGRGHRRPAGRKLWHWLLWGVLGLLCVSGLVLINDWGPAGWYPFWRYAHLFGGIILLPGALAGHVCKSWSLSWRSWLRSFDPVSRFRGVPLAALLVPGLAAGFFLTMNHVVNPGPQRVLTAARVEQVPADPWTLDWDQRQTLPVRLANGVGFRGGVTEMRLRAVHDGQELCVRADWDDAAEHLHLFPWRRTADGWERLNSRPEDHEDKMSIAFAIEPSVGFERMGCAYACHLGGDRVYGYKSSKSMLDIWHWKRARTQNVGQVDDQYWTAGDYRQRGRVGRKDDPAAAGGYTMNGGREADHPAHLAAPAGSPSPAGVILKESAVPYAPAAAEAIPEGTIIPGVITSPFEGDRGDVTSLARFEAGQWSLIIRRKLSTGSLYDVSFAPGGSYAFAATAFDHTRFRHAYHYGTYRLVLGP